MAQQSHRFSKGQLGVLALALIVPAAAAYRYGANLRSTSAVNSATYGIAPGGLERTSISGLFVNGSVQRLDGVRPGTSPVARFALTDFAGRPIKVDGVSVSCGCMTPHVSTYVIAPKGRAAIDISINLSVLRAPTFEKEAVVYFGGEDHGKSLSLRIIGTVDYSSEFSFIPTMLDFGDISPSGSTPPLRTIYFIGGGEWLSQLPNEVDITDASPRTVKIEPATAITSNASQVPPGSRAVLVRLALRPPPKAGAWDSELVLELDSSSHREVRIPIHAVVARQFIPRPRSLIVVAPTNGSEGPPVALIIRSIDDRPVHVRSITSDLPLKFLTRGAGPPRDAVVDVNVPPGNSRRTGMAGSISLTTEGGEIIRVPVVIVTSKASQ